MDILNLDDVVAPRRSITLNGTRHQVNPTTVEGFVKSVRALQALEKKAGGADAAAQIELAMDSIQHSVPSMTREVLGALTLEQLGKINLFLRGELDDQAHKTAEGSEGEKKPQA